MSKRGPKTYDELIRWLKDDGYKVEIVQSGHLGVYNPRGNRIGSLPNTPSDYRSFRNSVAMLRRLTGLKLRR